MVTRGDELLVRSRPEKGLLGGMTEVPTSDWWPTGRQAALKQAPMLKGATRWHRKTGVVTHVFTHFPLELVVYTRERSRAHPRPGRHALGADRDAEGRGVAQRHAQGDRARARVTRSALVTYKDNSKHCRSPPWG